MTGRPCGWNCTPSAAGNGLRVARSVGACAVEHDRRRPVADRLPVVVVHPEEVERFADLREVAVVNDRAEAERLQIFEDVFGVGTPEQRVEEDPVELPVDPPGGIPIPGVGRVDRARRRQVQSDAEGVLRMLRPHRADRPTVGEQQVVRRSDAGPLIHATGGMHAADVAEERGAPRLVEGRPRVDAVTERVVHGRRVVDEPVDHVAVGPAAELLERLGHVPVIERRPRTDAGLEQFVDEPRVEVETLRVRRSPVRSHATPRRREPVGVDAEFRHDPYVFRIAVVVIAGDPAIVSVDDRTRHAAERIPDRVGAAVLLARPLDLERRRRGAEPEALWKAAHAHPFTAPCMMPETSWRPAKANSRISGAVASSTPASTIE